MNVKIIKRRENSVDEFKLLFSELSKTEFTKVVFIVISRDNYSHILETRIKGTEMSKEYHWMAQLAKTKALKVKLSQHSADVKLYTINTLKRSGEKLDDCLIVFMYISPDRCEKIIKEQSLTLKKN